MTESIHSLYSALKQHGIRQKDVSQMLPSWWEDEIAATASGLQQAKLIVAKALNLKIRPLIESPPRIEFDLPEMRRFKLIKGTTANDVDLAVSLARSASKIVLSSFDRMYFKPGSAKEVREEILSSGRPWVDLEDLINYCFGIGIPVIHLASSLMKKKMDGIAMMSGSRPTIVLSSKKAHGYLLFHLAHELGHIALGHLEPNGAIVDTEITKSDGERDEAEKEADNYALELLSGSLANVTLHRFVKAPELARQAIEFGTMNQIAPTHVVLNSAFNGSFWGLCNATLKILGEGKAADQTFITERLFRTIDEPKEDNVELLRKLVGA